MRNTFFLLFLVFPVSVLWSAGCTATANVGDLPSSLHEGGAGDAQTLADTGGSEGGGSLPDAEADAPIAVDAGCGVDFAQQGAFIDVQSNPGAPPQYNGGTIVAGTYRLVSMTFFTPKSGTVQRRETLVVRGTSPNGAFERLVEQQKPTGSYEAIAAHGESSTFMTINGQSTMFEDGMCPARTSQTGDYEVTAGGLKLYNGSSDSVESVYQRVP